ncbi:MAG: tellurite resistance TerB family protein [Pseudomonadota bacterium]
MDAKAILDILMQSGMGKSQNRLQRAASSNNPLLDMAGSMLGGGEGGAGGGALGNLVGSLLGGGQSAGGGGALGNLVGSLLGGGGGQAAGGGLAGGLIGSLAKAAMSQMGGGASGGGGFDLSQFTTGQMDSQRDENDRALVMIRAMLTAAKADGQIDAGEQQRILGKLDESGANQEMRQFIQSELQKPVDIESIAAEVDSPHMATEVYTASLFAIDVDTPGEQAYMNKLASRLGLPATLVKQLHDSLEVRSA